MGEVRFEYYSISSKGKSKLGGARIITNFMVTEATIYLISIYDKSEKGRVVISGATDLTALIVKTKYQRRNSELQSDTRSFEIAPGIGYFIANNLAVGISAAYSYDYTKFPAYIDVVPDDIIEGGGKGGRGGVVYAENITTTTAIIPSLTYFFPVKGNFKPILSVGAGYAASKERDSENQDSLNNNTVYNYRGLSINGAAGVAYFPIKSVSFNLSGQYSYNNLTDKIDTESKQKINAFGAMFGIAVYF